MDINTISTDTKDVISISDNHLIEYWQPTMELCWLQKPEWANRGIHYKILMQKWISNLGNTEFREIPIKSSVKTETKH